jgi:RimJ/RimL family protein N-acetyltransferase/methionyl-tRNA formyltransferase
LLSSTPLVTPRLQLRNLTAGDVSERYLSWLHDPEVVRYLEIRFAQHTSVSTTTFIEAVNQSADTILFGIFLRDGGQHIGNIKLGPVNAHHGRADIGLMLGDRRQWGKGHASEAISAITKYAFAELGLQKVTAGCYEENVGSLKTFLKVGFMQEARLADHWQFDGTRQAELLLGISRSNYQACSASRPARFGAVERLTLIGGGALMVECARNAKRLGYRVGIILAPRHASEALGEDASTVESACRAEGFDVAVVEDINQWLPSNDFACSGPGSVALCFGPAWIFSADVVARFEAGMLNFNGIPIPRYLGGAHYTWQILNGDRAGGCFLQEITSLVDQGDVVRHEFFDLPATVRVPQDYFDANFDAAIVFLRRALEDFRANVEFSRSAYDQFNARRLYFPRLLTRENAYIDWRWSGSEIERFCNAFDDPYAGAATFWKDSEIRLHGVHLETSESGFHPYACGVVVRTYRGRLWVAVSNGILALGSAVSTTGSSVLEKIKEGDRLATPDDRLWNSFTYRPKFTGQGVVDK